MTQFILLYKTSFKYIDKPVFLLTNTLVWSLLSLYEIVTYIICLRCNELQMCITIVRFWRYFFLPKDTFATKQRLVVVQYGISACVVLVGDKTYTFKYGYIWAKMPLLLLSTLESDSGTFRSLLYQTWKYWLCLMGTDNLMAVTFAPTLNLGKTSSIWCFL